MQKSIKRNNLYTSLIVKYRAQRERERKGEQERKRKEEEEEGGREEGRKEKRDLCLSDFP